MNLDDWKKSGDYFDYEGYPIFYRFDKNESETLLCLHGFPTASFDYHKIWNELKQEIFACRFRYDRLRFFRQTV